jgi:hypothetical protein
MANLNAIKFDSTQQPETVFKGRINLRVGEGDIGPSSNTMIRSQYNRDKKLKKSVSTALHKHTTYFK